MKKKYFKIINNVNRRTFRKTNKSIKYKNSKKLLEKLEEEKKIKYFERYNRIQIKSIVEFYPPWAKKKKNVKKKRNEIRNNKIKNAN